MSAPAPIKYLSGTLRDRLAAVTKRANDVGERVTASVDNLNIVLNQAEAMAADLDKSAAEIQAALGLTNGGPVISDGAASAEKPAAATMTRTPTGFVAQ
ncbi:hypothetical protein RA307_04820 [Xanthobacteraceae bacterium Astr-EGSB]|uniref:hypothetical protein n=1 Tax=Astrobacterium formosum TaxID=3069710 RepID=UPI0027AEB551|nr:hypothetical protein [Xanthobacteraceae bacterium Astr-EGSB]